MNQIVCSNGSSLSEGQESLKCRTRKNIGLWCFFGGAVCVSVFCFCAVVFRKFDLLSYEKVSNKILESSKVSKIYGEYDASLLKEEIIFYENGSFSVIGSIEIKKIDVSYPILSDVNTEHLKLAPCRLYGPLPNEVGNLCIAAHNYKNGTFFSDISKLTNGDVITIYDISGKSVNYEVYDIFRVKPNELDPIRQNTDNSRIVTLITCDSINDSFRAIVKAKEIKL